MKLFPLCSLFVFAALPAQADSKPGPAASSTANRTLPKEHISSPAPTQSQVVVPKNSGAPTPPPTEVPAAKPPPPEPPKLNAALDAYLGALNDQLALSKDEQTDIKTYYEQDGAKLQAILSDASLSPVDQQRQVDDLRNARNAKIQALLKDVDRQAKFLEIENSHRVDIVQMAADGGLTPGGTLPRVPEPTATTPAQADRIAPGT